MTKKLENILTFDTATTACSVALKTQYGIVYRHVEQANIHSKALLQMIHDLLKESGIHLKDLDVIVVGNGPGSFTGLRIGIGVAQGLSYSNSIPILMLSTLELIALNAIGDSQTRSTILVAHDARMSEMYVAEYQYYPNRRLKMVASPFLLKPAKLDISEFHNKENEFVIAGNAWEVYFDSFDKFSQQSVKNLIPEGSNVFPQSVKTAEYISKNSCDFGLTDWQSLMPQYVRNDIAKKSTKK